MYAKIHQFFNRDSGVSPVISVILIVAIVMDLVALVTVVVFYIGGDVSDSLDATVSLEQTSNRIQARSNPTNQLPDWDKYRVFIENMSQFRMPILWLQICNSSN
jgi:hypothetical protein